MLSVNSYPQDYVDSCRSTIASNVSAYRDLIAKAIDVCGATTLDTEIAAFEPVFFNNLLIVLDGYFTHRARGLEKKDGNPLNEVRVLCNSMTSHHSTMTADKTIKLDPDESVLGYRVGDKITLSETDFLLISKAFFAELERKFV